MVLMKYLEAQVYISMDGSGVFTGTNDRVTPYTHHERGVEFSEGKDGSQQLSPPRIGTGGFDLKNDRGRFSTDNPGSPVYQQLLPGRPVKVEAQYGERRAWRSHTLWRDHVLWRGRGTYPLARHVVDDLPDDVEIGTRRVNITTISYETVLTRSPVTVPLMLAPRVSECFTALLDAAKWPSDKRDIAISDTSLLLWWCDERNPWDAMLELMASEGPGAFYVTGDGVFHFENRNYRTTQTRSVISQATYYDRENVGGITYQDLKPENGFKSVYNRATYTTRRRLTEATAVLQQIYQYGAVLTLSANQSLPIYVRPSDPFVAAVSPLLGTDYAVTAGAATVTLTYSSGFLAIITITAGPAGATINDAASAGTGIQLRAKPLTVVSEATVANSVDASASIAKFSPVPGQLIPITLSVAGWPEIDPVEATGVCDSWVLRQQVPRKQLTFRITNGSSHALQEILRRRVSDRFTLVHENTGLTAAFWINGKTTKIHDAAGRTVDMIVQAEQCDTLSGAVWDSDLWDNAHAVWGV